MVLLYQAISENVINSIIVQLLPTGKHVAVKLK